MDLAISIILLLYIIYNELRIYRRDQEISEFICKLAQCILDLNEWRKIK